MEITPCPVCQQREHRTFDSIRDHFLSQEDFEVLTCASCGLHRTFPYPSNLDKYYESDEYLSHGDDQKGLFAAGYRLAKNYNLQWKLNVVQSLHSEGHILDYGCGTGDFIDRLAVVGYQVSGAEPSDHARSHIPEHIKSRVTSPEYILMRDVQYQIISLWHVLEHIPEPFDILDELKKKLRPNGHFLIAVPNPGSFDAEHYGEHWAAWDVPRHLSHFSPEQMELLAQRLGMQLVQRKAMLLDVFYVALLSERYKGGNSVLALCKSVWWNLKVIFGQKHRCSSLLYILTQK